MDQVHARRGRRCRPAYSRTRRLPRQCYGKGSLHPPMGPTSAKRANMTYQFPAAIRVVSGRRGSARDVDVLNATTGERVPCVLRAVIEPSNGDYYVAVYYTPNYPQWEAVLNRDTDLGPDEFDIAGVVCVKKTFRIRNVYIETALLGDPE